MDRFLAGLVAQLELPAGDKTAMLAAAADQGNRRLGRFHPPFRAILGLRVSRVSAGQWNTGRLRGAAMLEDGVLVHLQVLVGHVVVVVASR